MTRLLPKTSGGWLTAAFLVVVIMVGVVQIGNPHSYVSEAVARLGETNSGLRAPLTDLGSVD